MVAITLLNIHVLKYDVLSFLMTGMWGFLDGSLNTHVNNNLGFQFDTVSEPFAVLGMLSGVSVFAMELVLNYIQIDSNIKGIEYYLLGIAAYGFVACSVTYFFPYRDNEELKSTF
jgi:hypothetical protein